MAYQWQPMATFNPAAYVNQFVVLADCVNGGYEARFVSKARDGTYRYPPLDDVSTVDDDGTPATTIGVFVEATHYAPLASEFDERFLEPGKVRC
jgi:hypothetical protein